MLTKYIQRSIMRNDHKQMMTKCGAKGGNREGRTYLFREGESPRVRNRSHVQRGGFDHVPSVHEGVNTVRCVGNPDKVHVGSAELCLTTESGEQRSSKRTSKSATAPHVPLSCQIFDISSVVSLYCMILVLKKITGGNLYM